MNPEVLFQHLATETAVIGALRDAAKGGRPDTILDVGCGTGSLSLAIQLEFEPTKLHGIDLLPERVEAARRTYPHVRFVCSDASAIP